MRGRSVVSLAIVALCGCGASAHHRAAAAHPRAAAAHARPSLCAPRARRLLGAHFAISEAMVSQAVTTGNNEMPQCVLTAHRPRRRPVHLTVNLDNGPQPYFRLERTAVEASQQFGTVRLYAAPQQIPGLGMDADWFPDGNYLETTDGVRLITVTVGWPGSTQAERRRLAETVARPFLERRPRGATGYPSG